MKLCIQGVDSIAELGEISFERGSSICLLLQFEQLRNKNASSKMILPPKCAVLVYYISGKDLEMVIRQAAKDAIYCWVIYRKQEIHFSISVSHSILIQAAMAYRVSQVNLLAYLFCLGEIPVFHYFIVILPFWPKHLLLAYQKLACCTVPVYTYQYTTLNSFYFMQDKNMSAYLKTIEISLHMGRTVH